METHDALKKGQLSKDPILPLYDGTGKPTLVCKIKDISYAKI
jgi:hypothetical protein